MNSIAQGCQNLMELRARSCIYLGDDGICALVKWPMLEYVDLSGCMLVIFFFENRSFTYLGN